MKNKKYIWIGCFVLSALILTYSYKDLSRYYYVKMGNKNYYSKNYEKAIEYYEKALKIKEDYNIRINLIITDYQMKNYKKVLESPVENGFLKGNSLVLMSEKNPNNQKDLEKSLKYYKEEILKDSDINIKKNYEIVEKKLKEQQNQDNKNSDNNQQEDKKQNQNSDNKDKNDSQNSSKDNNQKQNDKNNQQDNSSNKQNNDNNLDNQKQNDNKSNQDDSNKQNSNSNQQDLDKNQSKNNNQENSNKDQQNNNSIDDKKQNNQNITYGQPQNIEHQNHQQKELQIMLKNLEKNEKQSFKNNERLIGVENKSETKNRW